MSRVGPAFAALLSAPLLESLGAETATVFGCWPDGRIAYVNPSYERFARDNGGGPDFMRRWGLGCSVFDVVAAPLQRFYRERFFRALDGNVEVFSYECSSAEKTRALQATLYPVGRQQGVLQVHSVRVEVAHAPGDTLASERQFRDAATGLIVMCMHCRRARASAPSGDWFFVSAWVTQPPTGVSHGLCEPCALLFYPV